jgi:hypothetical protein
MVSRLLLLALLVSDTASAASLTARVDRTAVALGEPVILTVRASGLSLDALDVSPLDANFEVFARTLSRGADGETLVLTLYPRVTGPVQLPALPLEKWRTAVLPLKVSDGSEAVPRVTANWTLDPAAPRVNQPARLTLAICDDGSLQWQRPALPTRSGRVLRALDEDEGRGERAGEPCTLHRLDWALLATRSGAATLGVPMLDASRFGQRLRFPGPQLAYRVAALPAWLPAHVPPVVPQVAAAPLPSRWPLNRPLAWRFWVTGGYSADDLKALLDLQLRETPDLGVYPPLIEAGVPDDPGSPLTRYAVTLFLLPRASGQLSLPALRLPWFDVAHGQLASVVVGRRTSMKVSDPVRAGAPVGPYTIEIFDPRWQVAGQMAAGLAGMMLLGGLFWQIRCTLRWRLARRRGLIAIRNARDVEGLASAVRRFSLTDQFVAPSLGDWQRRMRQETRNCNVAVAVRQLQQRVYGQASFGLATLQQAFERPLARIRPKSAYGWRRTRG